MTIEREPIEDDERRTSARDSLADDGPFTEQPRQVRKRLFTTSAFYIISGTLVGAYLLSTLYGNLFEFHLDAAAIGVPLEQLVSQDSGTVAELLIQPGAAVKFHQPMVRIQNESVLREVQLARQQLETLRIGLASAQTRRAHREREARMYQHISGSQLESVEARIAALSAERDVARAEMQRAQELLDHGLISRQEFDSRKAALARQEGLLREAQAAKQIARTSAAGARSGLFFSGNFLVGDLQDLLAEEFAARERVRVAEAALDASIAREEQRLYRAPCDGIVARILKSEGTPVSRGEALVTLQRARGDPYVEAYISAKQAGNLAKGTSGRAYVPAEGKRYAVQVADLEYTPAPLGPEAAARLHLAAQDPMHGLVRVKLAFVGLGLLDKALLAPGLPVQLALPKYPHMPLLSWIGSWRMPSTMIAARQTDSSRRAPRLWPPSSQMFAHEGARSNPAPEFTSVGRRVLESADKALRKQPAPVKKLESAGVKDKNSPALLRTRRAFEDADYFVLLALAHKLTRERSYLDHARDIVREWAKVNEPTGHPIDETRLEGFLWGLDLIGFDPEDRTLTGWLERWTSAKRSWKFGPNTAYNNHKTHHFKILLMLDKLLGRTEAYHRDLAGAQYHLGINIPHADGSSLDFHERDSLHYHAFNLEAWQEIALLTGCCRDAEARAFEFLRITMNKPGGHIEFANSTVPIDRQRAAAGFEYAELKPYDPRKAARAIFTHATIIKEKPDSATWQVAEAGREQSNLFHEARFYLWSTR